MSEGRRTGAWTGVALFVLLAIAVAISTRTAANASSGRGFGGNSATEPEILAMGGYVPTAQQMGGARFSVAGKQLRTRNLGAVDFVTDMEGVAVGNSLILTTHDGGTNWLSPAIPSIGETLDVVSCSTAQHCVAGGYGQSGAAAIFATVDAGSSWEPAKFPGGLADLQFLSCGSAGDCVAVGQPAGSAMWELTSTDGGQSWESGQAPAMAIVKSVECTGPSACVVGGSSASDRGSASGTGVIETSGDGGRSWTNASTPTVAAICAVPFGSNSVSCNGPLGPAQSGAMTPIWPVYGISCPDTSTCLAVSSSGPTLVSTDTGSTWQAETEAKVVCPDGTSGANCTEALLPVGIDFVSPTVGYMTTVDQCGGFNFETESFQSCPATVMTTTDAGVTWHVRASTDYLSAMSCPDATHCWAATSTSSGGGLIATSDGGAAWSQVPVAETGELFNTTCLTATVCLASGADADGRAVIERSTDGGRTYSPVAANAAVPNAGAAGSLPYVGSDANYISGIACPTTTTCIASSNAGLIRSGDAGRTWSRAGPEPKGSFSAYAVTCAGPATCLSGTSAGLLRTTDDGVTWQAVKVSGVSFATFVDCSPSGLCVLNQVSSTSIYVSRDAGATWARVQLPGAGGNVGSDTSLPAVAAMSCWDQADCDVVGWSYVSGGAGGAYQWYLVRTTDGGVTWSASILRAPITNVGSLSCSTNANCLIAGSVANGTALWALDGTQISPLPTPSWGAYGFLASLVCPKVDRCIGTAMSDDAVTTFSVTVTGAATAPGWTSSLPSPREAFSNIGDDVGSAALATGATLFVTFPAQLFNLTFEENYPDLVAWSRRLRRRLRRVAERLGVTSRSHDDRSPGASEGVPTPEAKDPHSGSHGHSTPRGALLVVAVGALLGTLLNPSVSFNVATLEGYVGVVLALLTSMALLAILLATYRTRRRMELTIRFHALPLGLVVGAICVIVSRLVNFQPGYLYGVVCGVVLAKKLAEDEEAHIVALSSIVTLSAAAVSWLIWVPVHAAASLPHASFPTHVLDTLFCAIFVSGLVNTVINLLPLRFLPGFALLRWRRRVWAGAFVVAVFGLISVLARSPVSPGSHNSPVIVTIGLFVLFGGGTVVFREHFVRKWQRSKGIEVHGLAGHMRQLFSPRPGDDLELLSAPGSTQVMIEPEPDREPRPGNGESGGG